MESQVRGSWTKLHKAILLLVSVLLFGLVIELLKGGARSVAPLIGHHLGVGSLSDTLGFGWLARYVLMSGSLSSGGG